ncbi:MAG TPA: D-alanyl-D-alanine carboxypeptidase/D-alanyl-D-alanine-endopeptidase [Gemmatimonadota bacterium]|nr:D-alanyl-D-alanine carboxypeptidase/D-alanyl-D-alanine-endopeptidase [Gemmatimonadota bacterium]
MAVLLRRVRRAPRGAGGLTASLLVAALLAPPAARPAAARSAPAHAAARQAVASTRADTAPPPAPDSGRTPAPLDRRDLARRLDALLDDPALAHAHVGLDVAVAETGERLYARSAEKRFTTASTTKLIVSSVALDRLGAGYRWETRALAARRPRGGALSGDLWLVGGGDPSLDEGDLRTLAGRLRARGVRRIRGDVVGDDRRFEPPRWGRGWMWDDLAGGWASGVSGLELHPGRVRALLRPGADAGDPATLVLEDPGPTLPLELRVRTGAPGSEPRLRFLPGPGPVPESAVLSGWIPADADSVPLYLATDHPTSYLLARVASVLADSGIRVDGAFRRVRPDEPVPDAAWADTLRSDSLGAVLREMLHPSDNAMAESLLRTLGAEEGRSGSDVEGLRVERETLSEWGVDPDAYELTDGSGMSRYDEVTPAALVRVLRTLWRRPDFEVFDAALPAPAESGTLSGRLGGVPASGAVRAKTGSLASVRGLAGYVTAGDGETLVFALLLNGYSAPGDVAEALRDLLVEQLSLYRRPVVPGWPSVRGEGGGRSGTRGAGGGGGRP